MAAFGISICSSEHIVGYHHLGLQDADYVACTVGITTVCYALTDYFRQCCRCRLVEINDLKHALVALQPFGCFAFHSLFVEPKGCRKLMVQVETRHILTIEQVFVGREYSLEMIVKWLQHSPALHSCGWNTVVLQVVVVVGTAVVGTQEEQILPPANHSVELVEEVGEVFVELLIH